ncbi:MAG: hypothetical protein QOC64_1383, partial [Solirubrobacteraceae bacterium]|nr:hypothetical protein [Solirubrobacteraceae bacterium]
SGHVATAGSPQGESRASATEQPAPAGLGEPEAPDVLSSGAAGGMVVRGGLLRVVSYLVAMALSIATVPLVVRHLGVVDYGYYVTVSAIIFIIGGFSEAGLTYIGVREYVLLDGPARDRYLRVLAGLRFVLTTVGVAVAVVFAWLSGSPAIVVQGTAIAGVGMLLALSQQTYAIPLMAQLKLGWVSALELLKIALLSACFLVLVLMGAGLLPFFVANIVAGLGMLVATLLVVGRETSLRPAVDLAAWRRVLRDVLPYALAAAVGLIYFRLAVVLMSMIASDFETGIYSTAFRIVEVTATIPWIAVATAFPILARAARDDAQRLRYAVGLLFEASMIVGAGISLAIALGAPFAIEVVAGPGFEEAVPVLRLQGVALFTAFIVATWSFALLSLQAYRALLVCNAIAAVVVAGGTLALQPVLGPEGAALATLVGEAALAASYLLVLRRRDPGLAPRLGTVWKVPAAAGAGALAVLVPAHPAVQAAIGIAAYAAVLLAVRAVPQELVTALARRDPGAASGPSASTPV